MIVYDNRDIWLIFKSTGSALLNWRSFIPGMISFIIGFTSDSIPAVSNYLNLRLGSPTVYFNGVAFLVSFVVVFRSQLAYTRFFSALNNYFRMKARLLDLGIQCKSFCLSNERKAVELKEHIFRWIRLYHKLALTRLRGGYIEDIYLKNLLTEEELQILLASRERNQIVTCWMTRALSQNIDLFHAPAPIVGRLFQLASDVDLEFSGALMVAETPFPFPYAQLTSILLVVWMVTTPLFVSRWVDSDPFVSAILAFLSTWIIFAVNESAVNLESPTDGDSNDIPLLYYDVVFDLSVENAQFLPDPSSYFKSENKCFVGDVAKRRTVSRRVNDSATLLARLNEEANKQEKRNERKVDQSNSGSWRSSLTSFFAKPAEQARESSDSDMDSVVYVPEESDAEPEAGAVQPEALEPQDSRFVSEQEAAVLFDYNPNDSKSNAGPCGFLFNNAFTRFCSKSYAKSGLREEISVNVDASTLRAQGKFTKYI